MSRGGINMSSILQDLRMKQADYLHPEDVAARAKAAAEVQAKQVAVLHLPPIQQAALLMMTVGHVKNALIERLLEDSQVRPGAIDFRALSAIGLCEYKPGKRQNDLTPAGIVAARTLSQSLCVRFNIHLLIERGQVGWQQMYACTCGTTYMVRRSKTSNGNARHQWAADHATQDGMTRLRVGLKPPGMRAEG